MNEILKYFPTLTEQQTRRFAALFDLYADWNTKINVISRKDIENLYLHHVLHSLAIAKILPFKKGTSIIDVGTGGGFPAIPLAIIFPECTFCLLDSVRLSSKNIATTQQNALPNGIICLKGGDLHAEIQPYKNIVSVYNLSDFFEEDYFSTKKAIYLPIDNSRKKV